MRLALLIQDKEYRDAFIDSITDSGSEVLIDVISKGDKIEPDALIVTDAKPADLDAITFQTIKDRIVFLSNNHFITPNNNPHIQLFKYGSISRLLAEISDAYNSWQGIEPRSAIKSKIIACCTDSDAFSGSRCTRIARQIIYRQGGSVLILPLGYINEHSVDHSRDINNFARLMYRVRKGVIPEPASISYTDSFGISRLILAQGRNPIAYLDQDELTALINGLSTVFETVILDISGCYRAENLNAIKNSGLVICLETGRRRINFEEIIPREDGEKLRIIKVDEGSDEDPAIDEIIGELYGIGDKDRYQQG